LAGVLATTAGVFPAFAMKLLDFVAVYGFILSPVGAIIVFEHFFANRYGVVKDYAEKNNISFNRSVFLAWLISFVFFFGLSQSQEIFLSFLTLPAWVSCGLLFVIFSKIFQNKKL
jgi:purine-cytosine permease-like protein